ncbi:hypothetical protein SORBI_3007G016200 [Sorghum bicolor]|uniref:Uncharacterized protein n=1 Tax=Sorghum bicolor TaxID=4558 RepID=C5YM03_SORBI|nr:hypothetical protein SORBI_3007G016200 [Sorghum bicolor]
MTELAAGAVSSLLAVVRNEALLLGGVQDDVQFIKEEMESMKSFLVHLARSTPPGGEHDEQVRTWMTQVRLLAQDCHNCIDLYLYSGNPHIHRAKGRLRRYFWWVYWFLRKLLAQHRAAVQLRQLKDRARDVGERRLRYGVEVPGKSKAGLAAAAATSARGGAAADNEEEDDGDHDNQLVSTSGSRTLDDYVKEKLWEWIQGVPPCAGESWSMVVTVAPPYTYQDLLSLVEETWVGYGYQRTVVVDIPAVHPNFLPLRAKEVLFYILRELKNAKSQPQDQEKDQQGEGGKYVVDPWEEVFRRKMQIYEEKKKALARLKIKENIKEMKVNEKLDKIKIDIQGRVGNSGGLPKGYKLHGELDKLDLDVLLQLLLEAPFATSQQNQGENNDMQKLQVRIAKKLKEHMEAAEMDKTLEKEKVTKHMELEGDEAPGKTMEEEDMVQGGEGEITDHMVEAEGEGEVTKHTAAAEEAGEISEHMEETDGGRGGGGEEIESQQTTWIHLDEAQYARIVQILFPKGSSRPLQTQDRSLVGKQATKTTTAILGADQIKQMIQDAKEDILLKLLEAKYDRSEGTGGGASGVPNQNPETKYGTDGESDVPNQNPATISNKIGQMMDKMKQEFRRQLKIKGLVDEIKNNLNYCSDLDRYECPLFILKVDKLMDVSTLEDTRNALSLLNCSADIMIITTTKEDIQLAKEYCYPEMEPIDYSLAGLYHDTVLDLIAKQQQKNNGDNYYHPQIFHDILNDCEPHELCMKIFTRALYANPKRSNEELLKLHSILRDSPTSFNSIAKVMFKFSYNDLPKEYKSCLLYLAIFPPGHKIRRSTLIGRWVAEGLTSKEDWHSSVHQANRCFDALVDRCLVCPADIGVTGKVRSCVVGEPIHGIITTIARKQHILETRLSDHLARHFSVFNDLQLRSSDRIDKFFQGLSRSSRVSVLKVLDLEGCECFAGGKNQRYLKDICRKMLLLKYLSLRRTDITQLPREINNLRELEVLDIRQTKVPPHATANVLLLKLKRLLAGNTDWTPRPTLRAQELVSTAVLIPYKIEKMVNMEILSNVKARSSRDLKDIGKLWQLRKLGVVVDDDPCYLKNLLRAISDLHKCLCSLSITLPTATSEATPSQELPEVPLKLKHQPKLLESLSISGTTQKGFLPLFIKDANNNLVKVTLSSTSLNKNNLEDLAKLPKLQFIRLCLITDIESLDFKKEEFKCLKYLLVEGSSFTKISFEDEAACMLEKMALSLTNIESVSGVDGLKNLGEVELRMSSSNKKKNDTLLSSFNNGKQTMAMLAIVSTSLEQGDKETQNMITFNEGEFQKLKLLTVDCTATTKVIFTSGSAPKLEKIVWSSSTSLSGINNLPKLKELEFNGDPVPDVVKEAIENHKNKSYRFSTSIASKQLTQQRS